MTRYRDNMTDAELESLLAECDALDAAYAECDADAQESPPEDEGQEPFDPVAWGWVGKDGRP